MKESFWTAERQALVRQLWADGHTTKAMAETLCTSKNAVIGIVHRMKLGNRPNPVKRRALWSGPLSSAPIAIPTALIGLNPKQVNMAMERLPVLWKAGDPIGKICQRLKLTKAAVNELVAHLKLEPSKADASMLAASPQKVDVAVAKPLPIVVIPVAPPAPPPPPLPPPPPPQPGPKPSLAFPLAAKPSPVHPAVAARPSSPKCDAVQPVQSFVCMDPAESGPRTCRWPVGDPGAPGFRFCTAERPLGRNYCPEHAAIAFVRIDRERVS